MTKPPMRTTIAISRLMLSLLAVLSIALPPLALAASGDWQPGPDAVLDNTYVGFIDLPTSGSTVGSNQAVTIAGWVVDRAADGWAGIDNVHVYDGLAGQGGTFLGQATFAEARPDVAQALGNPFWTNSGFALTLGPGTLAAGPHTLSIYAHTPAKGWWFNQVSVTLAPSAATQPVATSAAPPINVLVRPSMVTVSKQTDHYTIKGYALDPAATVDAGIDHVDIYMDEMRGMGGSTFIGRASLGQDQPEAGGRFGPRFETAGYQLDFKPVNFNIGNHHIYAYAVSSITGLETVAVTGFSIAP
ncbi:MAG: hypothetical protein JO020_11200 [Chloroflexi bacterium]|nr:hypothetical protein [Chloroflexota bacterium]